MHTSAEHVQAISVLLLPSDLFCESSYDLLPADVHNTKARTQVASIGQRSGIPGIQQNMEMWLSLQYLYLPDLEPPSSFKYQGT